MALAGSEGATGGCSGVAAVREDMDAGVTKTTAQTAVVGGDFIEQLGRAGKRIVMHEQRAGQNCTQNLGSGGGLQRTMQMTGEVRRRDVQATIRRVGRRGDRSGIGSP